MQSVWPDRFIGNAEESGGYMADDHTIVGQIAKERRTSFPSCILVRAFHFVADGVLHSADDGTCNTQSITVHKWELHAANLICKVRMCVVEAVGDCNPYYVPVLFRRARSNRTFLSGQKPVCFYEFVFFIYTRTDWQTGSWSIIEFSFGSTHTHTRTPGTNAECSAATWAAAALASYGFIELNFSVAPQTGSFFLIHMHPIDCDWSSNHFLYIFWSRTRMCDGAPHEVHTRPYIYWTHSVR